MTIKGSTCLFATQYVVPLGMGWRPLLHNLLYGMEVLFERDQSMFTNLVPGLGVRHYFHHHTLQGREGEGKGDRGRRRQERREGEGGGGVKKERERREKRELKEKEKRNSKEKNEENAENENITVARTTYPSCSGHHSVWNEIDTDVHGLEHVLEQLYDLQGQHVLPHIIPDLECTGLLDSLGKQPLGERGKLWSEGGREGGREEGWKEGRYPKAGNLLI